MENGWGVSLWNETQRSQDPTEGWSLSDTTWAWALTNQLITCYFHTSFKHLVVSSSWLTHGYRHKLHVCVISWVTMNVVDSSFIPWSLIRIGMSWWRRQWIVRQQANHERENKMPLKLTLSWLYAMIPYNRSNYTVSRKMAFNSNSNSESNLR